MVTTSTENQIVLKKDIPADQTCGAEIIKELASITVFYQGKTTHQSFTANISNIFKLTECFLPAFAHIRTCFGTYLFNQILFIDYIQVRTGNCG